MAECMLEMANFRNKRGWFGSDLALRIAKNKSEFDFWTIAGESEAAKHVGTLAQKLLTSCS